MNVAFFENFLVLENSVVLFFFFFLIRFVIFSLIERSFYAYKQKEKGLLVANLGTMFFYALVTFPVAQYLSNTILSTSFIVPGIDTLALIVRIVLYFIVADFLHYWIHRLMHLPFLWRIHMWHHSPKQMSWLAGFRTSLLDATVVNFAFIIAWPLLGSVGDSTRIVLLLIGLLLNDWMHLNIRFRLDTLGKFLVTPRYHHVHHSTDETHYTKNLASIFPIWDRLFGTYQNPDSIEKELAFGINEKRSLPRLASGL